ncbi:YcnI family protein [Cellulomonas massiliensis]|uniref:YcnI family copper-binding membrane protein n=1 Tax=Cellulomonas massiliensis TaxID=1465811 RepID=UPI0002DCD1CB|nr:YcnI family protein [Cellulomonas massiliensis]
MLQTTYRPAPATRAAAVAALAAALVLLPATLASAHVTVDPSSTDAGGWSVLTFRVPNEKPTASTTRVVVDLPTDHPLLSVSVRPVPGWTAEVTRGPLPEPVDLHGTEVTQAATRVTWTADDAQAAIAPGEFQAFDVSAGPLPDEAGTTLALPAHQTYDDGSVVDWADVAVAGEDEPEHPAPTLVTTPADGTTTATGAPQDAPAAADATDPVARGLAVGGLVVGLAGLATAVVVSRRRVS